MKTEISNKHIMFYADEPVEIAWESYLIHSCSLLFWPSSSPDAAEMKY